MDAETKEWHINTYEKDYRAFKIFCAKYGYSQKEGFHALTEIKQNQPPGQMHIER